MPIYKYRCQGCGLVSEVFLRSLADSPTSCPGCGSERIEKLVNASYVIRGEASSPGTTCCGRAERCETPPCSSGERCRRH